MFYLFALIIIIIIIKSYAGYMSSAASLSIRLGGLYCLYCLHETQPFKPHFRIYLSLGMVTIFHLSIFFSNVRLSVTFEVILWFKTCCNLCCNSLVFLGFDRRFEKSQKPCCCRERNRFKSRVCSCEENAGKERFPLRLS